MADGKYLIGESLREKLKSTISKVESIPFGGPVSRIPTIIEGDGGGFVPKVFRVCTATGSWSVESPKDVTFYGITSTPNTVSVINKIVSLPAPGGTNTTRIVNIAKDGTQWYLVSFQMSSKTAVIATATETITFIGSAETQSITFVSAGSTEAITFISAGSTQRITYASVGPEVDVVSDISASLNTSNCAISVTKTTTKIRTAGSTQEATTVSASGTQTATIVSLSGTQTAAIMSVSGTQTATIITGTYTATFVSLEI
jgi:hypothetical protein